MIRLSRLPGTVLRYLGLANSNVYPTMQIGKYYYHNYLFNASLRSWLVPDARLANKTNPEPKKEQPKQDNKESNPKGPPDPDKNPKDPNNSNNLFTKLFQQLQQLYEKIIKQLDKVYRYQFKWVQLLCLCLFVALTLWRISGSETVIDEDTFIGMLQTSNFREIVFVEQVYLCNPDAKKHRVEGRYASQVYFCEVLSFKKIMDVAMSLPGLKQRNRQDYGIVSWLNKLSNLSEIASDLVLCLIIYTSLKRGTDFSGMMKPKKKFEVTKNMKIRFSDVAGMEESKREVQEVVDFLISPAKYHALGATIPKGVLLTGPPGTGKTLLAKACAGEAGVPFYTVSGSDFMEVFVGVGASRVRQLFNQAKANSPSIIFIDELDAVGKKRGKGPGSNSERESTLNQLLVEMDGFGTKNSVIVMAATNLKEVLDPALVRAGRFDREVEVGLPDLKGRCQILHVHLTPLKLSPKFEKNEYAKRIAALSPGFSGAELANLCNEAAIMAARNGTNQVEMLHFELASERVIGGVERKGFISLKEKKTVAYHQSGHAVVSWFLEGADPLLKVTIIPRSKGSLGFAQYFINQNQFQNKQQLLDRICFILGGRCSELHFFKEVTTGAYDDLQKAYEIAYHLVSKYGMCEQIGYVAFPDKKYLKPFGQEVESIIDREIKKIIAKCTLRTMQLVERYENHIRKLSEQLLIKETIDARALEKILGKRPFPISNTFKAYLQQKQELEQIDSNRKQISTEQLKLVPQQ